MFRSIQFTGVSTLAFADVPAAQMSDANTLFSTASQLAVGLGITLGAIGIRRASRSATGCILLNYRGSASACRLCLSP
nr:Uncharacterised protein [Klebsiella pneumoniae]